MHHGGAHLSIQISGVHADHHPVLQEAVPAATRPHPTRQGKNLQCTPPLCPGLVVEPSVHGHGSVATYMSSIHLFGLLWVYHRTLARQQE